VLILSGLRSFQGLQFYVEEETSMRTNHALKMSYVFLLIAFACSNRPPDLDMKAADRALQAWFNKEESMFLKTIGEQAQKRDFGIHIFGPASPEDAKNPREKNLSVVGSDSLQLKTQNSNEYVMVSTIQSARFVWGPDAWYLVRVDLPGGDAVVDIHWKVESR
jgi:hypothetical protein